MTGSVLVVDDDVLVRDVVVLDLMLLDAMQGPRLQPVPPSPMTGSLALAFPICLLWGAVTTE